MTNLSEDARRVLSLVVGRGDGATSSEWSLCAEILKEIVKELERLQREYGRLGLEFPDQLYQGVFGMRVNRDETLLDAMQRWYTEFDDVRSEQTSKLERLRAENAGLRASHLRHSIPFDDDPLWREAVEAKEE